VNGSRCLGSWREVEKGGDVPRPCGRTLTVERETGGTKVQQHELVMYIATSERLGSTSAGASAER